MNSVCFNASTDLIKTWKIRRNQNGKMSTAPQLINDNMFSVVVDLNWWYVITRGQMHRFTSTFLSQLNCLVIIDVVRIELLTVEPNYVIRSLSKLANLVKEWENVVSHHMLLWFLFVQVVILVTHVTYDGPHEENYFFASFESRQYPVLVTVFTFLVVVILVTDQNNNKI